MKVPNSSAFSSPGEDATVVIPSKPTHMRRAVEVVPPRLSLANSEALMDARSGARGVNDVAQARTGLVVERVGNVGHGPGVRALAHHGDHIVAKIEGVRPPVEALKGALMSKSFATARQLSSRWAFVC